MLTLRSTGSGKPLEETEFLPAVLEVQESPPSPLGRILIGVIIAAFSTGILWASLASIDITATAQGKIIPTGHSKVVQAPAAGVINAIHAQNGMEVHEGDVLVELDTTESTAERERLSNEYLAAATETARLRALVDEHDDFTPPDGVPSSFMELQRRMLRQELDGYRSRLDAAQSSIDKFSAKVDSGKSQLPGLEAVLNILDERRSAFRSLMDKGLASRIDYLDHEKEYLDQRQRHDAMVEEIKADTAALDEARINCETLRHEFRRNALAALSESETKAASLREELVKADRRKGILTIAAPIDGTVQQLAVHTIGGVVNPAQELMVIAPDGETVEVEALIENKDIGFVSEGQEAEIKIESFPFTKYGIVPGRVVSLSRDAVPVDKRGFLYAARITMGKTTISADGKPVNLAPGMNVSAEIKTGNRRLMEYFLAPMLQGLKESARER
ncbi:MAG: HlyD family type I secretion periplasmic adaptor subunit [Nitrospirae bacterium]|nr:HlyD family type I secretion periplasmic adaptor subunit [Nitrospirota bacterium]